MNRTHLILLALNAIVYCFALVAWNSPIAIDLALQKPTATDGMKGVQAASLPSNDYVLTPRGIFSAVRAPSSPEPTATTKAAVQVVTPPPVGPSMRLLGIFGLAGKRHALFKLASGKVVSRQADETVEEWQILAISDGRVDIRRDNMQLYWLLDRAHAKQEDLGWKSNMSTAVLQSK